MKTYSDSIKLVRALIIVFCADKNTKTKHKTQASNNLLTVIYSTTRSVTFSFRSKQNSVFIGFAQSIRKIHHEFIFILSNISRARDVQICERIFFVTRYYL